MTGKRKLTPHQVLWYRKRYQEKTITIAQISHEAGVARSCIRDMVFGRTYKEMNRDGDLTEPHQLTPAATLKIRKRFRALRNKFIREAVLDYGVTRGLVRKLIESFERNAK